MQDLCINSTDLTYHDLRRLPTVDPNLPFGNIVQDLCSTGLIDLIYADCLDPNLPF